MLCAVVLPVYAVEADDEDYSSFDGFGYLVEYENGAVDSFISSPSGVQMYDTFGESVLFRGVFGQVVNTVHQSSGSDWLATTTDFSSVSSQFVFGSGSNLEISRSVSGSGNQYYPIAGYINFTAGNFPVTYDYVFQGISGSVDSITFAGTLDFRLSGSYFLNGSSSLNDYYWWAPTSVDLYYVDSVGAIYLLKSYSVEKIRYDSTNTRFYYGRVSVDDIFDIGNDVSEVYFRVSYSSSSGLPVSRVGLGNGNVTGGYSGSIVSACYAYIGPGSFSADYVPELSFEDKLQASLDSIIASLREQNTLISNGFANVLQGIQNVINAIAGLGSASASTPEQDAAASQYVQDMEDTMQKIDDANQIIEDNTNRPSADSIIPTVPDIIQDGVIGGGDEAATAMMGDFGELLASPMILNLLLMVFGLAFLSYVLFGKKE